MHNGRHDTLAETGEHATDDDELVSLARAEGNGKGGDRAEPERDPQEPLGAPTLSHHTARYLRDHVAPEKGAEHHVLGALVVVLCGVGKEMVLFY